MKNLRAILALHACAAAMLCSAPASAALLSHGDGSFTDTGTGYLWRSLAQYDGLDYASALALLPSGYHVASDVELATLTAAAPADPARFAADAAAMGAVVDAATGFGMIWGYYGDGTHYAWKADYDTSWNTNAASNAYGWMNWDYAVGPDESSTGLSIFAVDTAPATAPGAVPEPVAASTTAPIAAASAAKRAGSAGAAAVRVASSTPLATW